MKYLIYTFTFLSITLTSFAQNDIDTKYQKAYILLKTNNIKDAYKAFREIKPLINKADTIYSSVIWYYLSVVGQLEESFRKKENFDSSLSFGLEALNLIKENKDLFDKKFADREQFMIKNVVVSYFGLGQIEKANLYKAILYTGYKEKTLPKGIDGYFNYDFFTIDNKNIWGYEWYPELPNDRFSSSFTKVVYYVYSRNQDGTDKDQLYRFHVLMFHHDPNDAKFDYILERQQEAEKGTVSGTYYKYTYKKEIDYKKLKEYIKYIVLNKIEPETRRTISRPKNN